jgi:hypothetical protein
MRAFALAALVLVAGCKNMDMTVPDSGMGPPPLTTEGTEWVNFHAEVPMAPADIDTLMSGMFGANAKAGMFVKQQEVAKSFYVTSAAETATPDQVRLTFSFDDGSGTPRVLAATPASYTVGQIFITTVDAAMAKMAADVTANQQAGEIFSLNYQVTSTQGGTLSFTVNGTEGATTVALDVTSPHTSVAVGHVGQAVASDKPYDLVSGTVWFMDMEKDTFDYFTNHAYGKGATSGQNFSDFHLVPYDWLRLTVTPHLTDKIVDVAFEVVATDGTTRVPVAKSPASVMAGGTFVGMVDRFLINQAAAEAVKPGSSPSWQVPFYYDQPTGGGVVQVIAKGGQGHSAIAYSVASPTHALVEVPFVPYKDVTLPPPDPNAAKACYQLGLPNVTQSLQGVFQITFTASDVIKQNLMPGQTLTGQIGCGIYHASDVSVTGPNAGAMSVDDVTLPMADLMASTPPTFTTTKMLQDGEYQILCAQYVDNNLTQVSKGDPVTLPIGGFIIACNVNPVTVEFAILNPSNH